METSYIIRRKSSLNFPYRFTIFRVRRRTGKVTGHPLTESEQGGPTLSQKGRAGKGDRRGGGFSAGGKAAGFFFPAVVEAVAGLLGVDDDLSGIKPPTPLHNLLAHRQKAGFPMIGKYFSNGWKIRAGFPMIEKIFGARGEQGKCKRKTQRRGAGGTWEKSGRREATRISRMPLRGH